MLQDIQKTLWAAADKLRANVDAAEYKHIALGLIFLKFISDSFAARRAELIKRFADENDEYFRHDCDDEMLAEEPEERDYYREVNVFWVPEADPLIKSIRNNKVQMQTLATLRDTLLPRLIYGQPRLAEAEATLAEVA